MVTTELRRDPVTGRWVVIDRAPMKRRDEFERRPLESSGPQALKPSGPQAPELCAFCEHHESEAGAEVLAWRDGTAANGPGWSVRVVPNQQPVLRIEGHTDRRVDGLYESRDGLGAHEVVVETPAHGEPLEDLPVERLWRVLWAWRTRLQDLKRDRRFASAAVFKNHGQAAGALMDHAHSQVVAYPFVPPSLDERVRGAASHHASTGQCIYCEVIAQDLRERVRVVKDAGEVVVLAPYASRVPFETWLLPRAHGARFEEASDAALTAVAGTIREVLAGINWALERPAYNLLLNTGPFDGAADGSFHWHLEIVPRVTRMGGLEWGSGLARNPVAPEEAAAVLRARLIV